MPIRRQLRVRAHIAGVFVLAFVACAREAKADPQTSFGLTVGAAGRGYERELWDETAFHLGLRGDLLFARNAESDFGVGPYVEVMTHAFDEIQVGGGASFLVPIIDSAPLILSSGIYGRSGDDDFGFEPGWASSLWWGAKGYNFSSPYTITAGLLTQFRYGLGDSEEMSLVVSAQVDLVIFALPFIYLADAIRGGSRETDPVEPEITSQSHQQPGCNKTAARFSF